MFRFNSGSGIVSRHCSDLFDEVIIGQSAYVLWFGASALRAENVETVGALIEVRLSVLEVGGAVGFVTDMEWGSSGESSGCEHAPACTLSRKGGG